MPSNEMFSVVEVSMPIRISCRYNQWSWWKSKNASQKEKKTKQNKSVLSYYDRTIVMTQVRRFRTQKFSPPLVREASFFFSYEDPSKSEEIWWVFSPLQQPLLFNNEISEILFSSEAFKTHNYFHKTAWDWRRMCYHLRWSRDETEYTYQLLDTSLIQQTARCELLGQTPSGK